jgi:hypothetical protein
MNSNRTRLTKRSLSIAGSLLIFITALMSLSVFFINIGFSQENTNLSSLHSDNTSVFIRFHDKKIYHLEKPVIVEFQIVNHSSEPYLFITSFNKMFTFDFELRSMTNRIVEHSRQYMIDSTQFEPVLNDKIVLKKDEVYGVRIDISSWFDIQEPGEYILKGVFYPNLKTGSEDDIKVYSDNELYLFLNPPYSEELRLAKREEEIRKLKAEALPPYEVVEVMLKSLQERDFEKYFLYIKIDEFMKQFKNAYEMYQNTPDGRKPAVEEIFRQYLRGENTLERLSFAEHIPHDFEIERTVIEKNDATVTVKEIFRYINVIEEKRYTYNLHLYDGKWQVYSYTIVNIP